MSAAGAAVAATPGVDDDDDDDTNAQDVICIATHRIVICLHHMTIVTQDFLTNIV